MPHWKLIHYCLSGWVQWKLNREKNFWVNRLLNENFLLLLFRRRRRHQQRRVQRQRKPKRSLIQEEKNLLITKKKDPTEKKRGQEQDPKRGQRLERQGKVDIPNGMNPIQPSEWRYVALCSILCTLIEWLYNWNNRMILSLLKQFGTKL